jgi:hypothetical protein
MVTMKKRIAHMTDSYAVMTIYASFIIDYNFSTVSSVPAHSSIDKGFPLLLCHNRGENLTETCLNHKCFVKMTS